MKLETTSTFIDQCIKATNGFWGTTYTNICTGGTTYVEAGTIDLLFNILGVAFAVLIILGLAGFIVFFFVFVVLEFIL